MFEEFDLKPDMVLLGEPSKMQIARGQRGKLEMLVETAGVCAHTSVPESGDNAAYKLAKALLVIANFDMKNVLNTVLNRRAFLSGRRWWLQ